MSNIYSLWLIPEAGVYQKFSKIISELAEKYSSPNFEPHVTLLGRIKLPENEAISKTKQLASMIRPFKIKLDTVGYTDSVHKAVFVRVLETTELRNAWNLANQIFRHQEEKYLPHLSLLYGHFSMTIKEQITAEIGSKFSDEFTVDSIHLFDITEKNENMWCKRAQFKII